MNKHPATPALQVRYLILGGGLTGLSTAYHLEKNGCTDYLLIEKNAVLGGLCASEQVRGFTFDYAGHLLHVHTPYVRELLHRLLPHHLSRLKRRAFIDVQGKRVPFPFQANLWAAPAAVRYECIAQAQAAANQPRRTPKNFEQWCLYAFGRGMYRHFFQPYNEKLWQTPLTELTWDWCGDFVPTPNVKQIQTGAKRPTAHRWGYNTYFYYPKQGGCGALAEALADKVPNCWLQARLQELDVRHKRALINGKWVRYEKLVNTLPLPQLIDACPAAPRRVRELAKTLLATSVHVWQVALRGKIKPFHWIYFPDKNIPFFRVGMYSAFSAHNAPRGASSLYVETATNISDFKVAEEQFTKILVQKGIIKKPARILFSFWRTLHPAYAIYNLSRARAVPPLINWLEGHHILSAGRYGNWEYSFIERSLLQGKEAAEKLLGK